MVNLVCTLQDAIYQVGQLFLCPPMGSGEPVLTRKATDSDGASELLFGPLPGQQQAQTEVQAWQVITIPKTVAACGLREVAARQRSSQTSEGAYSVDSFPALKCYSLSQPPQGAQGVLNPEAQPLWCLIQSLPAGGGHTSACCAGSPASVRSGCRLHQVAQAGGDSPRAAGCRPDDIM